MLRSFVRGGAGVQVVARQLLLLFEFPDHGMLAGQVTLELIIYAGPPFPLGRKESEPVNCIGSTGICLRDLAFEAFFGLFGP